MARKRIFWIRTHKYDEYHRFDWFGNYDYPIILSNSFEYCRYDDPQTGYLVEDVPMGEYMSVSDPTTTFQLIDRMIIDRKCR
jgi:hypothetical protein